MTRLPRLTLALAASTFAFSTLAAPAAAAPDLPFTPYGDLRWRLEYNDQDGLPDTALASTLRLRAGLRTKAWHGFTALAEGEAIVRLGPAHFNDGINGKTNYPVVADPSDYALNQLAIGWSDKAIGSVMAGRQALAIDNQRWIGTSGWRQNDQTFDAVRATVTAIPGVSLSYGHVWRVNRVFGPRSAQGIWRNTQIHLLNGAADLAPLGKLSAYGYWLDIPAAPAMSSKTFGARLSGRQSVGDTTAFLYTAEYARQSAYGANPASYSLDYVLVEPGVAVGAVTAKFGYERLAGNGRAAVQTPLASLHPFNGWADKFSAIPNSGLRDIYADVTVAPKGPGVPKGLTLKAVYHDFRSTVGGRKYGQEWNFQVAAPVAKRISLSTIAALYEADSYATDTMKLWIQAEAKF